MKFANPIMFWGILALLIPVLIHLWNKKKSVVLPWAATQFLKEKTLQQSRGLRLENLFLLSVRVLLLLVLLTILALPIFEKKKTTKTHWVLPDSKVVENYKFEISEALKNGEKVFWLNGEESSDLINIPEKIELQKGINQIEKHLSGNEFAEIYINNNPYLSVFSKVYVPVDFKIHVYQDSFSQAQTGFVLLENGKTLGIGENGEFQEVQTKGKKLHEGKFFVLNQTLDTGIGPSLKAISEVYGLDFEIHKDRKSTILYDMVFVDNLKTIDDNDKLVFASNAKAISNKIFKNSIFYFDEKLNVESSNEVINGLLPEFILEQLMSSVGLKNRAPALTEKQILSSFIKGKEAPQNASLNGVLILFFLFVLILERWLALKSNK